MVQDNYSQMFKCPKCGEMGTIFLVKIAGNTTVVKMKCPKHGGKTLKISTPQINKYYAYLRDGVFRCYKCGLKANVDHMKVSGPWTLVRMKCGVHGNSLPYQKIWSSVYGEIVSGAQPNIVGPQKSITTHLPSGGKIQIVFDVPPFCPYCKAPINANNVKWVGPSSVICPYCETTVPCNERKINP